MDGGNLRKFIRHHPKCQAVKVEAKERMKDVAESKTFELMKERHWPSIQYFLATQCKDRGYLLPKGTQLNTGEVTNGVVIQSVTINAVESGHFYDDSGRLTGPGGVTIESGVEERLVIDPDDDKPA